MPAALPVDWTAIKEAMIAGVTAQALAIRYGMVRKDAQGNPILKDGQPLADTAAIRQRCKRERWPAPRAIIARATHNLVKARMEAAALERSQPQTKEATPSQAGDTSEALPQQNGNIQNGTTSKDSQPEGSAQDVTGDQGLSRPGLSLEIIAEELAQIAGSHPLTMARHVRDKIAVTVKKDLLPAPSNWREMNQADTILRRAVGLERSESAGVQVNVGVWGNGTKVQEWRGEDYDV